MGLEICPQIFHLTIFSPSKINLLNSWMGHKSPSNLSSRSNNIGFPWTLLIFWSASVQEDFLRFFCAGLRKMENSTPWRLSIRNSFSRTKRKKLSWIKEILWHNSNIHFLLKWSLPSNLKTQSYLYWNCAQEENCSHLLRNLDSWTNKWLNFMLLKFY